MYCSLRDYTNPAARAYWAESTADLFNELGAEVCQWDGAEFQPTINGWGTNHSNQTWAGDFALWRGATLEAFIESKALWKAELAVEMVRRLTQAARYSLIYICFLKYNTFYYNYYLLYYI